MDQSPRSSDVAYPSKALALCSCKLPRLSQHANRQQCDSPTTHRTEDFDIGFLDRFTGIQEKSFEEFEWGEVAFHRIYYFKFRGKVVWDRRGDTRLDLVFGSKDGTSSIYDWLHLPKLERSVEEGTAEEPTHARPAPKRTAVEVAKAPAVHAQQQASVLGVSPDIPFHGTLLGASSDPTRPNFFLCWKLSNDMLLGNLAELQLAASRATLGLPGSALVPPGCFHLSLGFLRITSPEQLAAAVQVMQEDVPGLLAAHVKSRAAARMRFAGCGMFGTRILHTHPVADQKSSLANLFAFQHALEEAFRSRGVPVTPVSPAVGRGEAAPAGTSPFNGFAPHVSIVRITPGSGTASTRLPSSLAAELGVEEGEPIAWGEDVLRGVHLCSMRALLGEDGFYTTVAKAAHPAFLHAAPAVTIDHAPLQAAGLLRQDSLPADLPSMPQLLAQVSDQFAQGAVDSSQRTHLRSSLLDPASSREQVLAAAEALGYELSASPAGGQMEGTESGPSPTPAAAVGTLSLPLPGVPPPGAFPAVVAAEARSSPSKHALTPAHQAVWRCDAGDEQLAQVEKVVVILRGIPGAGKSTLIKALSRHMMEQHGEGWAALGGDASGADGRSGQPPQTWKSKPPLWVVASADTYFINKHGEYVHDFRRLKAAHKWAKGLVRQAADAGVPLILVDNTATRAFEYRDYEEQALSHGYSTRILEVACPNVGVAHMFAARNTHGVPPEKVVEMWARWEHDERGMVVRPHGILADRLLPPLGGEQWKMAIASGEIDAATGWLRPRQNGPAVATSGRPRQSPARPRDPSDSVTSPMAGSGECKDSLAVSYVALFLPHRDRLALLQAVPPAFSNKVVAEHVTLCFAPPSRFWQAMPVGQCVELAVTHVALSATNQAVQVQCQDPSLCRAVTAAAASVPAHYTRFHEQPGWKLHGFAAAEYPHITISLGSGGKAVASNRCLLEQRGGVPLSTPLTIKAVVGLAVTSSKGLVRGVNLSLPGLPTHTASHALIVTQPAALGLPALDERYDGEQASQPAEQSSRPASSPVPAVDGTPPASGPVPRLMSLSRMAEAPPSTLQVFDFDGTLFLTPGPKEGRAMWKAMTGADWEGASWLAEPGSLSPPMPVYPGPALPAFRAHNGAVGTRTVVMTARHVAVAAEVRRVCHGGGVTPDSFVFNRGGAKGPQFKATALCLLLDGLLAEHARFNAQRDSKSPQSRLSKVVVWEDLPRNIEAFKQVEAEYASRVDGSLEFVVIDVTRQREGKAATPLPAPAPLPAESPATVPPPPILQETISAPEDLAWPPAGCATSFAEANAAYERPASPPASHEAGVGVPECAPTESPLLAFLRERGMLRSKLWTNACDDALDAVNWAWCQVLATEMGVRTGTGASTAVADSSARPPLLGFTHGSFPLGKAHCDVDACLLCPASLPVDQAVLKLAGALQRSGLTHAVSPSPVARIPKVTLSMPHPAAPSVEMDLVFASVQDTAVGAALQHCLQALSPAPLLVQLAAGELTLGDAAKQATSQPLLARQGLPSPLSSPREVLPMVTRTTASLDSILAPVLATDVQEVLGGAPPRSPSEVFSLPQEGALHSAVAPMHLAAVLDWLGLLLRSRWQSGSEFHCVRSYHLLLVMVALVGTRARGVKWLQRQESADSASACEALRLYPSPEALLADFLQHAAVMGVEGWRAVCGRWVPKTYLQPLVDTWSDVRDWLCISQESPCPVDVSAWADSLAYSSGAKRGARGSRAAMPSVPACSLERHLAASRQPILWPLKLLHAVISGSPPLPAPGHLLVAVVFSAPNSRLLWLLQQAVHAHLPSALRTLTTQGFQVSPGAMQTSIGTLLSLVSTAALQSAPSLTAGSQPPPPATSLVQGVRIGHTAATCAAAIAALRRLGDDRQVLTFSMPRSPLAVDAVKEALQPLQEQVAPVIAAAAADSQDTTLPALLSGHSKALLKVRLV